MWTVDPKIPLSLWWAILIAAVVAIAWYVLRREWSVSAGRRWLLSILLGLGVVGPLLIALNPTWVQIIPPVPGQPMLTVLVDGTISMKTEDCGTNADLSRWAQAIDLAEKVNSDGHRIEVRKMAFGELVKPLVSGSSSDGANSTDDRWPQGHRSDLAAALRQTTRAGSPVGHAVLMISDGAHNVGSTESVLQTAREANAMATPIYTVTLGSTVGMKNMSIVAKSQRMIAFPNNPIAIRAILGHNGLAGQSTQVQLLRDEEVLQTKTVRLQSEPTQEIRFNIEQGAVTPIQRYRIVASELFGEATTADNQTTVLVQRLNEPIGVLVLEGKPYWDSKFLARNLASDPVVQLTTLVKLGPGRFLQRKMARETFSSEDAASVEPKFVETTQSDWTIEKDLKSPLESTELLERFRLVILGRDASEFLTGSSESDTHRDGLGKRIEIMDDYQEGLKMGRLEQRPVVVILGAIWCSWCRKLESELDSDDGSLILQKWVVVKVDVDQDPEVAELLEASALPGIRVIGLDEKVIASREGYSPVKQLQEWLESKQNEANPKIQRVLYEQGEPTEQDITELVQFLAHRSPNIRSAASDRLIRNRSLVADEMIQTLKTGRLIQKLTAL